MLSSMLMTTALAAVAFANPLQHFDKRAIVYEAAPTKYVTEIVATVTVWDDAETSPAVNQPAIKDEVSNDASVSPLPKKATDWGNGRGFRHGRPADSQPSPVTTQPQVTQSQATQAQNPPPASSPEQAQTQALPSSSTASQLASAQAPASSSPPPASDDYAGKALWHHNVHRANHSAPALTWNTSLVQTAQKIGQTCYYEHMMTMDGGGYGQNIAAGVKSDNVSAVITELFYNGEVRQYQDDGNFKPNDDPKAPFNNANFHAWGHMTQMVWLGTTSVGCVTVDCSAGGLTVPNSSGNIAPFFTVCNYYPPGMLIPHLE